MSVISNNTNRYSDQELAEFKIHIEQKLARTIEQSNSFLERIENISQSKNNEADRMDETSNSQDLEFLYEMLNRQQKHSRDLENALIRIQNKRYGICVITGQLIDKRRLMAVPTTSKSLEAKIGIPELKETEKKKPKASKTPTSFSKIIKRSGGFLNKPITIEKIDFDDEQDEDFDFDFETIEPINLDQEEI